MQLNRSVDDHHFYNNAPAAWRGGAKEHLHVSALSRVFFRVITKRKNIYIYVIKRGRGYGWQRITTRHEYLRTVRKGTQRQ